MKAKLFQLIYGIMNCGDPDMDSDLIIAETEQQARDIFLYTSVYGRSYPRIKEIVPDDLKFYDEYSKAELKREMIDLDWQIRQYELISKGREIIRRLEESKTNVV
jgi:hypothetical protein